MWTTLNLHWSHQWPTKYSVIYEVHWSFNFFSEVFTDRKMDFLNRQNHWTIILFSEVFTTANFFVSKHENQWTFTFFSEPITDLVSLKNAFVLGWVFTEPSHVQWTNHWKIQICHWTLHRKNSSFFGNKQQFHLWGNEDSSPFRGDDSPPSQGENDDLITDHHSNTNAIWCFWMRLIPHTVLNLGV